ncbi:hypothetical protein [Streptomyces sp. NPDC088923]|uniref:hypothetical protein n=1 Tax=Streptomyces sp. NPDC088923 TaxID=3365913 RepID=UPI00381CA7F2
MRIVCGYAAGEGGAEAVIQVEPENRASAAVARRAGFAPRGAGTRPGRRLRRAVRPGPPPGKPLRPGTLTEAYRRRGRRPRRRASQERGPTPVRPPPRRTPRPAYNPPPPSAPRLRRPQPAVSAACARTRASAAGWVNIGQWPESRSA